MVQFYRLHKISSSPYAKILDMGNWIHGSWNIRVLALLSLEFGYHLLLKKFKLSYDWQFRIVYVQECSYKTDS